MKNVYCFLCKRTPKTGMHDGAVQDTTDKNGNSIIICSRCYGKWDFETKRSKEEEI